ERGWTAYGPAVRAAAGNERVGNERSPPRARAGTDAADDRARESERGKALGAAHAAPRLARARGGRRGSLGQAVRRGGNGGDVRRERDPQGQGGVRRDRKSTRLNSSHVKISYAVFCLKKKK